MSQVEPEDHAMPDAENGLGVDEISISDRPGRIQLLEGYSESGASFQFEGEDHTLGNALRYIIMKNPDVEFCGYSIPHPSENKMNIRIQTYGEKTPSQALRKGLKDLEDLCNVVTEKFTEERDRFESSKSDGVLGTASDVTCSSDVAGKNSVEE